MKFSDRANAISPFLAMEYGEKANKLEQAGHDVVRLNLGEPDFGAPKEVSEAMLTAVSKGELPYTSALGLPALRQAVANFYLSQHGVEIDPSRVIITSGASAALLLISAALIDPEDNVILGDPSYPCNRRFITSFGGDVTLVPTPAEQHFQLTAQDVENNWRDNTKGVLIASPANPTGTCISETEMSAISAFCEEKNAWRIVDEIYLNLALSEQSKVNTVLTSDDKAIVINSFSKYFGMTGWRLGWCVVPPEMVAPMEKLAHNLYICPSTPAQYAALACFTPNSLAECEARRATLINRKTYVLDALNRIDLPVEVHPDGAFYVYINIAKTGLTAIEFCNTLLAKHYVAMTPGNDFGEHRADEYVRLSFATDDQNLKEGLKRIGEFVKSIYQG